jgi:hypothetical protein
VVFGLVERKRKRGALSAQQIMSLSLSLPQARTDPVRVKIPKVALKRGEKTIAKTENPRKPETSF